MKKVTDMTQGNIWRLILTFAFPLLIGNVFQLSYSFIDTIISSHLISPDALSGIGATSSLNYLIVSMSSGMGAGASIIISQSFGARNSERIKNSIFSIILINLILSLVVTILIVFFIDDILSLLSVPSDIYSLAKDYFLVLMLGLVATLMYNTMSGILKAFGNSLVPLIALIICSVLNILGDLLFISVFKLGLKGSAMSTVLCEMISAFFLFIYLYKKYPEYRVRKENARFNLNVVSNILRTGLSMGLMSSVFAIGGILMSKSINSLGSTIITARTVGRRLVEFSMLPLGSIASACSVFVSQNFGARNLKRANEGIIKSIIMVGIWSIFTLALIPFERNLAILVAATNEEAIIDKAVLSLNIALPFYFILGVLLIVRMALQSMRRNIIPIISSLMELTFKVLSGLIWIPKYGYIGEAVAEPISWVVCGIFVLVIYIIYYKKGIFLRELNDDSRNN